MRGIRHAGTQRREERYSEVREERARTPFPGKEKMGRGAVGRRGRGFRTHLHVVMQFDNIMDYAYTRVVLNKLTVIPMRHGKGWEHRIGTTASIGSGRFGSVEACATIMTSVP